MFVSNDIPRGFSNDGKRPIRLSIFRAIIKFQCIHCLAIVICAFDLCHGLWLIGCVVGRLIFLIQLILYWVSHSNKDYYYIWVSNEILLGLLLLWLTCCLPTYIVITVLLKLVFIHKSIESNEAIQFVAFARSTIREVLARSPTNLSIIEVILLPITQTNCFTLNLELGRDKSMYFL